MVADCSRDNRPRRGASECEPEVKMHCAAYAGRGWDELQIDQLPARHLYFNAQMQQIGISREIIILICVYLCVNVCWIRRMRLYSYSSGQQAKAGRAHSE